MENINTTVFQLKKVMKDIKNYNKEWRYIDAFQRFVKILNDCAIKIGLPEFQFESFHLSNTGKTINDIGYDSLANYINLLEGYKRS
ncbi:hypothetical protein COC59_26630 [Bacillus cereus]|nr:hypothetical protein COJ45_30025 [Bacillus cereus]PGS19924.1 hypothetical protein COC59_26630 [Bacillus cereus]